MLAFYTGLSTLASVAQQIHTYLRWTSIKLEQFDYVRENLGNPELSIAGPSVGIDLIFFYIRKPPSRSSSIQLYVRLLRVH